MNGSSSATGAAVILPPEIEEKLAACEARVRKDVLDIEESIDQVDDGIVSEIADEFADTSTVHHAEELDSTVRRTRRESTAPVRSPTGRYRVSGR